MIILALVLISALFSYSCVSEESPRNKPNVLFIAIDDLRPELGCYGSEIANTPNLDQLAAEGILFESAYCQQAICSPSRASLMTGAYPETIGIIENSTYFRDLNPDIITLPQHFTNNGYESVYVGKIYHGKFTDRELSWSRDPAFDRVSVKRPKFPGGYALPGNQKLYLDRQAAVSEKYGEQARYGLGAGPAYEKADVPDNSYVDGWNTDLAIATLEELVENKNKPFFLALGFHLPHLNWNAPKKYWDLYDPEEIPMTFSKNGPEDGAEMGLHASFELRVRHGIPKSGNINGELARKLKHAYMASVSYVDAQVGRMLKALEESGVADHTIVIVWSDHGWHLGDMGIWGKATNYEIATRVPVFIRTPDMPDKNRGRSTNALVELLDIYPTLCELVGLEEPEHLEGTSFAPLLGNPDREWKKVAFSQFPTPALREWAANPLSAGMRETYFGPLMEEVETRIISQQKERWDRDLFENHLMGYSMRTEKYRLVLWKDRRFPEQEPLFVELYDLQTKKHETVNIADSEPTLVKKLIKQFNQEMEGRSAIHH